MARGTGYFHFFERQFKPAEYSLKLPQKELEEELARDEKLLRLTLPVATILATCWAYHERPYPGDFLPNYSNVAHFSLCFVGGALLERLACRSRAAANAVVSSGGAVAIGKEAADLILKPTPKTFAESGYDLLADATGVLSGWSYERAVSRHIDSLRETYSNLYLAKPL
jgi:hypothetical protein